MTEDGWTYTCGFCRKQQNLKATSTGGVLRIGTEPACQGCYDEAQKATKKAIEDKRKEQM